MDATVSYWDAFVAWLRALLFGREMEIVVIGASTREGARATSDATADG
jgi:hypothetical protein